MNRILRSFLDRPESAALVLLVALIIVFQILTQGIFLSEGNLRVVLGLAPEAALVAAGVGLLMISGEFDLSVGSTFAIMPMATVVLYNFQFPFIIAFALGLLLCALIGLANGLITIRFAIPSFITTLGMLFIVRSLTVVMSGGFPPRFPKDFPREVFVGLFGPLRVSIFWFLALAVLVAFLLERMNFGNWVRATGGNLEAAESMGVNARRVKITCFIICSTFAGFAGFIQSIRLGSALPSLGEGMELQAIAAAVIGGTALTGGVGSILGAVVGALMIRVIDNGLVLSRVEANWFKLAIGAITIFAVVANSALHRRVRAVKVE